MANSKATVGQGQDLKRERRELITQLAKQFLGDLSDWLNHQGVPDMAYLNPTIKKNMSRALDPFFARGDGLKTNFGDAAAIEVQCDLDDLGNPAFQPVVDISFTDRSEWHTGSGQVRPKPLETRVRLLFDAPLKTILSAQFRCERSKVSR